MKAPDPKAVPAFSDSAEIVVQKTTTTEPAMTNDRWLARAVFGLVLGWFSISLVCLAWQSLRFRWQMRHVAQAAPSHRKLLDSICESRGIKHRVQLLKSDRFEAPVAYGLFQPTILIPAQVEQRLNRDELAALLSHELAHLVRGDIWWLVIGRVLTTCFAFQPLNFLARRHWQEDAEFQCDDWAIDCNVNRLTLARSLTLVAEWREGRKSCAGVVSAGGATFHISDRVERLVADAVPDHWRRGSRRLAIHFATLAAAGAVIVFGPQIGSADRAAQELKPDSATVEKGLKQTSAEISTEEISALVREVEGLSEDVSELLAELRTIEPLLAKLEQRPELADHVSQLRVRIGLLRKLADER
jgi:beta-lactamase regulating signal transducer with metallopeptidase domain